MSDSELSLEAQIEQLKQKNHDEAAASRRRNQNLCKLRNRLALEKACAWVVVGYRVVDNNFDGKRLPMQYVLCGATNGIESRIEHVCSISFDPKRSTTQIRIHGLKLDLADNAPLIFEMHNTHDDGSTTIFHVCAFSDQEKARDWMAKTVIDTNYRKH